MLSGPEPWLRAQDTPGLYPRGHCGAGRCLGFPGGGGWGVPGPQSIRWALNNLPELSRTWTFSCSWGPGDDCRETPHHRSVQRSGREAFLAQESQSDPRNIGVGERSEGEDREEGKGTSTMQRPELAPAGRPGYYCPELPAHGAGANLGRLPLQPREAASGSCL